ncbi:hypothetical protein [Sinorhizobium meliloti]|uniref:hypothetical protein n=2 Tax=Rhizobium meliloti TaxID=382 RepID=UPI000FDADD9A|nr:hypothetical protein [Sinorhizobium meliloti]RVG88675.1 hypothetical protein CN219_03655 [Sinorhizobium meliloti]RVI39043.1 hypothetical protein CN197_02580 [Sinorhizobium meliloti]RVI46678.1 hypothetical protein CN196_09430 [Sinorhizobium meliloti]RVJ25680.1 hypothetical protein CN177_13470 [Sinorhizobium meliloti]RVK02241.1 hypothetical protein CN170_08660 [Sinorhizobium meliloti]
MADKRRPYRPWLPVTVRDDNEMPANHLEIRKTDCVAIQAIAQGVANEDQQKRGFAAILHICAVNDLEFLPVEHGGERESTFKSGMRHTGMQLRKLVSFPLNLLTGEKNDGRDDHDRRTGKPRDGRNADRAKQ